MQRSDAEIRKLSAGKVDKPLVEPADGEFLVYNATTKRYEGQAGGGSGSTDHTALTNIGTNTHVQIDSHLASASNPHSVTKSQVGLANADNTSDANKPISTATQTALDLKAPLSSPTFTGTVTLPDDTVTYAKMQNVSAASKLLGRGDSGVGDVEEITLGSGLTMTGTTLSASGASATGAFGITIDGGGSAITTGLKGFVRVPFNCTITGWELYADQTGSIVIDVWKDTYANFPPIVGDSIAGTEKPTLSSAQKNQDTSLSTWTTSVTAGDVVAFNVDSVATVTRVNLFINVTKS